MIARRAIGLEDALKRVAALERDIVFFHKGLGSTGLQLGERGDILGHHPDLDRGKRRIDGTGVAERIPQPVGLPQGARQHQLGRNRDHGAPTRLDREAPLFGDLRRHILVAQARRAGLDDKRREIPLHH